MQALSNREPCSKHKRQRAKAEGQTEDCGVRAWDKSYCQMGQRCSDRKCDAVQQENSQAFQWSIELQCGLKAFHFLVVRLVFCRFKQLFLKLNQNERLERQKKPANS